MNELLWTLQALLAGTMLATGAIKAAPSGKPLAEPRIGWVGSVSVSGLSTIGLLELGAAVGLLLPWAVGIAPVVTPLAAVGVTALMMGAITTSRRHRDLHALTMNVAITVVAVVVAVGRFGDL